MPVRAIGRLLRSREAWALADQSIVSGSNFVTGIVVGRSYGLEDFSLFTLCWMFVLIVQSLGSALIVAPMLSIGPKQEEDGRSTYFGTVFVHQSILVALASIIVVGILSLPSHLLPDRRLPHYLVPLVFCLVTQLWQDFLRRYLFLRARVALAIVLDTVSYVGRFALMAAFLSRTNAGVAGAFWAIGLASSVAVLLGLLGVERLRWNRAAFSTVTRRHWKLSSWLAGSALMQWTSWNLYVIIAPYYLGSVAVGILRAGQNLLGPANIWLQGLENVVPSRASHLLHVEGLASMKRYLIRIGVWCGLATLALVIAVSIRPDWLLSRLYGDTFAQGEGALRVYSLVTMLMFVGLPLKVALRSFEHTRPIFFAYVLMTVFASATAVPLIKLGGLNGALAGILTVHVVYQVFLGVAVSRRSAVYAAASAPEVREAQSGAA